MIDKIIRKDIESIIESVGSGFLELAGKTILITGANGFIASYFADTILFLNATLLKKNPIKLILLTHHKITRKSRLSHCINNPNAQFIVGDVASVPLPNNIDIIINGASKASPKEYLGKLIETADVNVLGTKKLLEYCVKEKISKFLLVSSAEVYGDPDPDFIPIEEVYSGNVDQLGPRSAYQESKRFAETLCSLYWKERGISSVIARLFHTYGPRLSLNDGRVIPEFIRRAHINEDVLIADTGSSIRTFAYISDSISGLWKILIHGQTGQAYNIGSEEEIDISRLAELIIKLSNSKSRIVSIPSTQRSLSPGTPNKTTPSLRKIKTLGHTNKIPLELGLKRLIGWYKNQRAL